MSHRNGILLEDMNHKFDIIIEYLAPMASLPGNVAQLKTDMCEVKTRLTTVEIAVTDLSKQHCQLDSRVKKLKEGV